MNAPNTRNRVCGPGHHAQVLTVTQAVFFRRGYLPLHQDVLDGIRKGNYPVYSRTHTVEWHPWTSLKAC